jgi:hypothetical protein
MLWKSAEITSAMTASLGPASVILIALSGRMNSRQSLLIDCLREENRVPCEQLGDEKLRFNDDQRRRSDLRASQHHLAIAAGRTTGTEDFSGVWLYRHAGDAAGRGPAA